MPFYRSSDCELISVEEACNSMLVNAKDAHTEIVCSGDSDASCKNLNVNYGDGTDGKGSLSVDCQGSRSCQSADLYCPIGSGDSDSCSITCGNGIVYTSVSISNHVVSVSKLIHCVVSIKYIVDYSCSATVHIAGRMTADVQLNLADDATSASFMGIHCVDNDGYTKLKYYEGVQTDEWHKNPNEDQNGSVQGRWECAPGDMGCCPRSMAEITTITCAAGEFCEV